MKKLKTLMLCAICFLITGTTLTACQKDEGSFSLLQNATELLVEERVDLNPFVSLTKLEIKDLNFKSYDSEIAYVTPDYHILGVAKGNTIIRISYGNLYKDISVVVKSTPTKLQTPTGLHFNSELGRVVWNEVYGSYNNQNFKASNYTLAIKKSTETDFVETTPISNKTYYEMNEPGTYTVKVKTNQRDEEFLASDYSQEYTFTILSKPTNLQFNTNTQSLSWDGTATNYRVYINGLQYGEEISEKSITLNLTETRLYRICIEAVENDITSIKSNEIIVTKLTKPTVSVQDGYVTWNSQNGAGGYIVTVTDETNNNTQDISLNANVNRYKLEGNQYDNTRQLITVTAIAMSTGIDNNYFISSDKSNQVSVTKLKSNSLVFDVSTKTLSLANSVQLNTIVKVQVAETGDTFNLTPANEYKRVIDWEYGDYTLTCTVLAPQNSTEYLNSDLSEAIIISVLAPVTNLTHSIDTENNGILKFTEVENANDYKIIKIYSSEEEGTPYVKDQEGKYNIGDVNYVFRNAGDYKLKVEANNNSNGIDNHYYIPSSQEIIITRLADVAEVRFEKDTYKFIWTSVENAFGYEFIYTGKNQSVTSTTNLLIYEDATINNNFGVYTLEVRALGNNKNILKSLNTTKVEHKERQNVDAPTLTFDIETETLKVSKNDIEDLVRDVQTKVWINDVEISVTPTYKEDEKCNYYDLSTLLVNSGSYTIKARVVNNSTNELEKLINASETTSFDIVRLNTPEQITINENNIIIEDLSSNEFVLGDDAYNLIINNIETSVLDNSNYFEIKLRYNAVGEYQNNYYLNSPIATFEIERIETPTKPTFLNGELISTISTKENVLTYLVINQGTTIQNLLIPINESIMSDFLARDFITANNINKNIPFDVALKYGYDYDIVVNNGEKQYISSLISEKENISKLNNPANLKIVKSEDIKIIWDSVENAENYTLKITNTHQNISTTIETTSYTYDFAYIGEYNITLVANSSKFISSETSNIVVERLSSPDTISVDKDENIVITNSAISNRKISRIKIEIESVSVERQEITDLNVKQFNENFTIYATNIAREDTTNIYYISSESTAFKFERISKVTNLSFSENNISWVLNDDADGYELKFAQGDKVEYLTVGANVSLISISSGDVQSIISQFNQGEIAVYIRPLANTITNQNADKTLKLSCLDYTQSTGNISILNAPTELQITSSGEYSENINLYFKHSLENVKGFDIYDNNEFVEFIPLSTVLQEELQSQQFCVIKFIDKFTKETQHNISLVAVGANGHASSSKSETVSFTRLKPTDVSTILIDSTGTLKWQNISNASYKVFLTLSDRATKEIVTSENPLNIYDQLFDGETLVVGDATIEIRSIGDGVNYLNSKNSEVYTFNILQIPTMEIGLDYITVKHNNSYTTINMVVKYGSEIVTEKELNPNQSFNIPSTYVAGEYTVIIKAKSTLYSGVITSQTLTQSFTKLEQVTGYKFVKVSDGNEYYFRLQADKNTFASSYVLTVKGYEENTFSIQDNLIYYNITNKLEKVIGSGAFTMNVQALGGKIGDVYYTNSNISSISAYRLSAVENFKAFKNLTWDNKLNNNGYLLRVNSDYINLSKDSITYPLTEYTGSLVLNIKALGNVGYEGVSENAILDSQYIGVYNEDIFEPANLTANKLEEINYLSVNNGYITFNYNADYDYEIIASNSKSYLSSESNLQVDEINSKVMLFNNQMYADFKADQVYSIRIKVIAKDDNILNSNLSNLNINVEIPSNSIVPSWTLNVLAENKYDLSNTTITWADLDKGYGYLVRLNNVVENYNNNQYLINDFEAGQFTFEVAIKGGSEIDNGTYLLTSKYSERKVFNVLDKTQIKIKKGQITWDKVENASKYYVYLNDTQTKIETTNTYIDESIVGQKIAVGTYTVSVQAVTDLENYFAGQVTTYVDKEQETINVHKLNIPKDLTLTDGTFSYSNSLNFFGSDTPFKYTLNNITEQILRYKLISTTSSIYYANVYAIHHMNIDVDSLFTNPLTKPIVESLPEEQKQFLMDYKNKIYGWPNYTRLFDEFASHIPAGEYQLSISQMGNDINYLTSEFGTSRTVYVPNAPKIYVSYSEGVYTLNISKVIIPNHITSDEVVYNVYGKYIDENDIEQIKLISSSTSRTINLSELVENNTINSTFTEFFAIVKGNSDKVLNGKTSNSIKVKVLTKVEASIQNGILNWKSQNYASAFKITYKNSETGEIGEVKTSENLYLGEGWLEGNTYIEVKIQALGTENNQLTELVLDGPKTEIGTIIKLMSTDWYIEDGIVYWQNIENSTKYVINSISEISDNIENSEEKFTLESLNGRLIQFNPQLTGYYSYFVKTIGSENLALTDTTTGYVNSNFASCIYSYKHTAVDGIKTENGELIWNSLEKFIGYDVGNYLLTFECQGQEDIVIEINSSYCLYNGYNVEYSYGLETLKDLLAGNYNVYIQGFAKGHSVNTTNNNTNFSYFEDGKTIYLLLSEKQQNPFAVQKLNEVTDIIVTSVEIDGKYTSSITFTDTTNDVNAVYELTFVEYNNQHSIIIRSDDENRKSEFVHNSSNCTWTFYGIINESMEFTDKIDYTLQIRRLAITDTEMNSNYTKYYDTENANYFTITQINPITQTEIILKNIDGNDHYVISWEDYLPKGISNNLISYVFEYYSVNANGEEGEARQIFVTGRKYVNYDTEIIQESGTAMISYKVRVMIGAENTTTLNFINSRFSQNYEIKTPNSVENITYDSYKQVFTWEYENTDTNNLVFIVKDYFVGINEIYVNNLDKLESYVRKEYTINVNKGTGTYEFAPQEIGYHVLSIEVCVANFASSTVGDDEAFKSGAVFYINAEDIYSEVFNLFTSGAGTTENPYIISNATEFNNINLRKITPSYIKSKYTFKQSGHLEITSSIEYTETDVVYNNFITGEFDGIYDGDNYSLKVNSTIYELNIANGIFAKLLLGSEIRNIHLLTNITGNITSSVNFAILTKVNYGKISNIKIGNLGETGITFNNIEYSVGFGMIANENRGNIDKVVNNYNITATHSGKQSMASADIGGVVRTNYGTITNSGNNGHINVTLYEGAVIGGIASKSDGGTINSCFAKGIITVSYYSLGASSSNGTYYIGGIVGNMTNDSARLTNSYSSTVININHNNINPNVVYVGGIAGNINLPILVSNSYSNAKINVQQVGSGVSLSTLYYYLMVGNIKQIGQTSNSACYYNSSTLITVAGGTGASNFTTEYYTSLNDIVTKLNTSAKQDLFYLNGQQINLIVEQELNADIWKK